jgi:predicted MPP superfamily phosphohydrolase
MRLVLFVSIFLFLYGGIHLNLLIRIKRAFIPGFPVLVPIFLFFFIMIISPIIVRALERWGLEDLGRGLAYGAYLWMGFVFIHFVLSLIGDILSFIAPRLMTVKALFAACTSLAAAISIYGVMEALQVGVEHITIASPKITPGEKPIRIAQVSDVHLGLLFREERLKRVVERLKEVDADIVVSTGDLVDGQTDGLSGSLELLKGINPPMGKYAVTGNHEFYAGIGRSIEFTRQAGFKVLRGEAVTIKGRINIAGVDDPAGGTSSEEDERKTLSSLPKEAFTLLLKHRPHAAEASIGLFDLQLSGHTHKGQIFPFGLLVRLVHGRLAGLHELPSSSFLYISRGSGTWGPPMRVLAPPEVTVIDIVPAGGGKTGFIPLARLQASGDVKART